ncbi:hypothetical protein [Maritimibacter dapengensis]|uniref:hypothetical protein n=1 Tax=Maritimibacter dapengensis TaxID=2836868 RepID=UPI002102E8BE|nr:hypothetical protein [Maritimibacter dapengensis]
MLAKLGLAVALALVASPMQAQDAKQILTLTRQNWVAVREYDGKDLLYFTNLLAWRCGVEDIRFGVNGEPPAPLEHEPCHADDATPNALYAEDILPYLTYPLGSVETITVEVDFPDGSTEVGRYERAKVAIR